MTTFISLVSYKVETAGGQCLKVVRRSDNASFILGADDWIAREWLWMHAHRDRRLHRYVESWIRRLEEDWGPELWKSQRTLLQRQSEAVSE